MGKIRLPKLLGSIALSIGLAISFGLSAYAETPRVDFIDVSHHNAETGLPLSFYQTLKMGGVNAVVVKVSEGQSFYDGSASVNIANAKAAGEIVHAYHYARYTNIDSAIAEAKFFDAMLQKSGFDKNNDGNVIVDIEENSLTKYPFDLTQYTNIFVNEMYRLGYSKVDIYSGSYYYNNRLIPTMLYIDKPWLASYPYEPDINNVTAKFSNGVGAWQWSSSYYFKGMESFGRFDVSMDISGKYTMGVMNSTIEVKQIGNVSLVNYMKSKSMDASYDYRAKLAESYGIVSYQGTAAQNLALLSKLQNGVKPSQVNLDNSKLTTSVPKPVSVSKPVVRKPISKTMTYKVTRSDSLSKIAKKFNLSVSTLASMNHIRNVNLIHIGQVLKVSKTASVKVVQPKRMTRVVYYTVRKGDTVSEIAHKYKVSSVSIKSLNRLNSRYTIYIGQKLMIK